MRAIRAPRDGTDERDAAHLRFVGDIDVAAARAPARLRDDLAWLAARAFAADASEVDWARLHRAVARLLDDDVRRADLAHVRLRRFVLENDDLP